MAEQCCNFKKQCCSAIKQSITVRDRIVFATKKTVAVTRITGSVQALPVSVAKKSINDALPVMSETEFIFIAGKQTCSIQATFGLFSVSCPSAKNSLRARFSCVSLCEV